MASPAATGVAERALLLVRRLRVDRPLAGGMDGFAGELIDRIRAAKANARRGVIGAGESLYFEDEIALECAIVAASLGGIALPDLVRRTVPDSETPMLRWRRRILRDDRKLPQLLAALVEAGTAGSWLARFDAAELHVAGDLLLRAYGGVDGLPEPQQSTQEVTRKQPASAEPVAIRRPAAIEEALAHACAATPDIAARTLIAIALLATRRPELVVTQALADALVATFDVRSAPPVSGTADRAAKGAAELRAPTPAPVEGAFAGAQPRIVADRAARPTRPIRTRSGGVSSPRPRPVSRLEPAPSLAAAEIRPPAPVASECAVSDHAGLFFLLNIFLALGLYGDFTDPGRRVRGLSPFALMLMLARHWDGRAFARDPLASMLRTLAGLEPGERPGADFEAQAWQVPLDWLAPWPTGKARTTRGRFGTSRWHAAGFPIEDRWHDAPPAAWVRRRWVTCLARYIEARLARALGSDDRTGALAMLVQRRGTVRIAQGEIEVAFDLDTHPLAIRLAGLDRDPGWIPAAGHAIRFRFA